MGRAGSPHDGAPSEVQPMQLWVAGEQNGVTPPQSTSLTQPTQAPPPAAVSQRGTAAPHREVSTGVHAAQTPSGRQSGVPGPHSAPDRQPRQVEVAASQMGLLTGQAEVAPG
jgi:hypothetical protein